MDQIIHVQCTFIIPVVMECPDDDEDYYTEFAIEENSCPGTGIVGRTLENLIRASNEGAWCWACTFNGTNKIVRKQTIGEYLAKCRPTETIRKVLGI